MNIFPCQYMEMYFMLSFFFLIVKTFIFGISQMDSVYMIPILLARFKAS